MMTRNMICTIILAVVVFLAGAGAAYAQAIDQIKFPKLNEINVPEINRQTLDNGIRLYLLEDHSLPTVDVYVRANFGSYLDPADKIGLADICSDVMRSGGTQKWTGDEIDATLEGIGASVETFASTTSSGARLNILSDHTNVGLEILAEVLRRPVFDPDKIELSRMQMSSSISRRNDRIGRIAGREFRKLIYGADSPYARHTEYATVHAITRDDLVTFHSDYYHPEHLMIAVWGDFDTETMLKKIKSHFGDWQQGNTDLPPLPEINYDWRSKVYYIEKPEASQSYIKVGHLGGLVADADYADRIVMNTILGGGFGSRLMDAVRTRLGLAYSVYGSYSSNFSYPGTFSATASTKPESTVKAAREMIAQIASMATDAPTEAEMKKGRDGYLNSFVFNFDSRAEVIRRMVALDYYGLPEDFIQQEKIQVEEVSPDAVVAAAGKNIRSEEMVVLVVGNAELFDEPLEALGLGAPVLLDVTIPDPN